MLAANIILFIRKNEEKKMTKGCKIWLWILFIAQIISAISGAAVVRIEPSTGIYTIVVSGVAAIGIAILLFMHKRYGFYLYVLVVLVGLVINIKNGINIGMAVFMAVVSPLITFLFMQKNQDVFD